MFGNADELFKFIKDEGVEYIDVRSPTLPGIQQQLTLPASTFDADMVPQRRGLRRLLDPRLPDDRPVRHGAVPRRERRRTSTRSGAQDDRDGLLRPRPDHRRGLLPRPAQHRPQGRGLPRHHRHRRHRLLRARGRVLHLRPRQLRHQRQQVVLRDQLGRGRLDHRRRHQRQPRLQGPLQGRLLPRRADRQAGRPAQRHDDQPRRTPGSSSSAVTTRSARPARPRSTTASTRC